MSFFSPARKLLALLGGGSFYFAFVRATITAQISVKLDVIVLLLVPKL